MNVRTLTVLLVLVLLGLFAGLNWPVFTAPSQLNLLFTKVEAPLGLVMLGVVLVLTLLYVLFSLGVEASALIEIRRYARELHQARRLLDQEEESRFVKLRKLVEESLAQLREDHQRLERSLAECGEKAAEAVEGAAEKVSARCGELEEGLKEELASLANRLETVKLQIREVEKRLDGELGQSS